MSGPEILLILVAVFACGRLVARWRDPGPVRAFGRGTDYRRLIAAALILIGGFYAFAGLVWACLWGVALGWAPHDTRPTTSDRAAISGVCLGFAWLLLWLGVRIGRGGGLPERLARAAGAAWREFHTPTDAGAKPKPDAASQLLD